MMYHDALSLWMDKDTQDYIKRVYPGMENRFVKPVGATCAGTRYAGSPPGNSPEHARAFDAYGFSDLKYAMSFNATLARIYPIGDPRRVFNQGTPAGLWHLMAETWTTVGAPSNARVAEDIAGWEVVCDKIIEAKGCIVPDDFFCTGHRARRIHGEGERKTKLRKRDRKSTMHQELPVHPGLKSAYGSPMGSSDVAAL